ncbi:hypothetical protein JCGZ_10832 [Jatropha curcas]|uniref:Uncharacterized protein n=1 Tax=Jatropha curcas TaxID=180498 RepID=A0A067KUB2_JATCU|nr:hypothetical protein JCGZ_10832 [Jatropha curcas]
MERNERAFTGSTKTGCSTHRSRAQEEQRQAAATSDGRESERGGAMELHFTILCYVIAFLREKSPQEVNWLRTVNCLVIVEEPSIPFDLSESVSASSLGSDFEIENSSVRADLLAYIAASTTSTSTDKMGDSSIPISEIGNLVEKIVAASLEKLLQVDKAKDHVVIEDDKAKGESEKKEQMDDTW